MPPGRGRSGQAAADRKEEARAARIWDVMKWWTWGVHVGTTFRKSGGLLCFLKVVRIQGSLPGEAKRIIGQFVLSAGGFKDSPVMWFDLLNHPRMRISSPSSCEVVSVLSQANHSQPHSGAALPLINIEGYHFLVLRGSQTNTILRGPLVKDIPRIGFPKGRLQLIQGARLSTNMCLTVGWVRKFFCSAMFL